MKAFRSVSRPFALTALLLLALVTPVAWVYANSGAVTNGITGRAAMRHYFRGQNGTQIALNAGYYVLINMTYGGEIVLAKDWKIEQGPRRTGFPNAMTMPLDWYQTMTVRVNVYRAATNQKIDTFNWSAKLTQEPGVGFRYRCKEPPGESAWPVDMGFNFCYEKGTDPAASFVNVYVR